MYMYKYIPHETGRVTKHTSGGNLNVDGACRIACYIRVNHYIYCDIIARIARINH